ncbi:hypothetical protein ARAM_001648 [Aspergillus rambellii]|uniref:AA1-like domain-containing protein n=1 Tax=Aspergillus rambellii TaxID=308745 RepID=A0A0F8V9J2_9EURO|nr:hypothetical protein ARAM_001648 [Aspergillus rambellii]
MKFTIVSILLAAAYTLATPVNTKRDNFLQITELHARASLSATMHFVVTDPNYPDDTPTECNLIWRNPKLDARCNNGEYYIRFPMGPPDFNLFTLELERVSGPIAEEGRILLSSNANGGAPGTKWICVDNPEPHVLIDCNYEGTLEIGV